MQSFKIQGEDEWQKGNIRIECEEQSKEVWIMVHADVILKIKQTLCDRKNTMA